MLDLINKFYKIVGDKNQYAKYISFLQTNEKLPKIEINKNNCIYNCIKNKIHKDKFIQGGIRPYILKTTKY